MSYYPHCAAQISVLFDSDEDSGSVQNYVFSVEPTTASASQNSYNKADTFECEFDVKDFPFSPELIRTMAVSLFFYQTDSLITSPPTDQLGLNSEDRTIVGLVDEATYSAANDEEGSHFKVSGRDYTCLFLDRVWEGKKVPLNGDWGEIIQSLVDLATGWNVWSTDGRIIPGPAQTSGVGIRIGVGVLDGNGDWISIDQGIIAGFIDGRQLTAQQTQLPQKDFNKKPRTTHSTKKTVPHAGYQKMNQKGVPHQRGATYWDVITKMCADKGLICFVRGENVIIANATALNATENNTNSYQLVFGNNVRKYEITRKLGKESMPRIRVYGYDKAKNRNFSYIYPTDQQLKSGNNKVNGIVVKTDEIREIPLANGDLDQAQQFAMMTYQTLSRSEGVTELETFHLKDINDSDLLQLRVGYPLYVEYDDLWHEQFNTLTSSQRYNLLKSRGFNSNVCEIIANNWDYINKYHRTPFYTKEVKFEWSTEKGIKINIKGINYINADTNDYVLKDTEGK